MTFFFIIYYLTFKFWDHLIILEGCAQNFFTRGHCFPASEDDGLTDCFRQEVYDDGLHFDVVYENHDQCNYGDYLEEKKTN